MASLPEWAKGKEVRAIAAMCIAMALFVGNDIFNKLSREMWPTGQVLATRGVLATAFLLLWVYWAGLWGSLGATFRWPVLRRGLLEGFVAVLFIKALGLIPLSDISAILMASTLIGTALSVPFLGESVGWRRWTAILVGFAGMLLVVRPTGDAANWGGLLAVASAIGVALRDIATRFVPREVPSLIVTLATVIGAWLSGIVLLPFETLAPFNPTVMLYLLCAAMLIIAGNYFSVIAFREVEIAVVSPFRYTTMIWSTLASGLVFGQWPGAIVGLGMALIVGSGLYTLHRERIRRRIPLKSDPPSP
jgi:drug/metabolite transporter (DMT)-like permease